MVKYNNYKLNSNLERNLYSVKTLQEYLSLILLSKRYMDNQIYFKVNQAKKKNIKLTILLT